jgi:zona occludens toxin (predicted ATPase)
MILMICGVPGSGKTLALVKRFLAPALIQGREIYHNIDGLDIFALSLYTKVEPEKIEKLLHYVNPKEYNKICQLAPQGAMIIVDEAQNEWNNREFKEPYNKSALEYMTKHRHYGHDVILATQNFEQVDIGLRRLGSVHYHLKRMSNIGFHNAIKVAVYNQCLDVDMKPIASETWAIDRKIFGLYKSYEGKNVAEVKVKGHHNVFLRSPIIWFMFAILGWNIWSFSRGGFEVVKNPISAAHKKEPAKMQALKCEKYYCGERLYIFILDGKNEEYRIESKNPYGIKCTEQNQQREMPCP